MRLQVILSHELRQFIARGPGPGASGSRVVIKAFQSRLGRSAIARMACRRGIAPPKPPTVDSRDKFFLTLPLQRPRFEPYRRRPERQYSRRHAEFVTLESR